MIHVKHILVKQQYEMDDLLRKLNDGMSFEDAAQKFSICPSGKKGGDLGVIREGQTVEEFEDAAFALAIDEMSGPVRTSFGLHLIKRIR
ncbi:MAG: peptidylprolyl isomerase [Bdellovibrionales bacterium]|nr:peptidylprolyl isomerase [Bdellovibrionales bacterium]